MLPIAFCGFSGTCPHWYFLSFSLRPVGAVVMVLYLPCMASCGCVWSVGRLSSCRASVGLFGGLCGVICSPVPVCLLWCLCGSLWRSVCVRGYLFACGACVPCGAFYALSTRSSSSIVNNSHPCSSAMV